MRLPKQLDRLENALLLKQGELNDHEWALREMDISCPDCKYEPDWGHLRWSRPIPYTCPKCSCPYHLPAVQKEIERLEEGSGEEPIPDDIDFSCPKCSHHPGIVTLLNHEWSTHQCTNCKVNYALPPWYGPKFPEPLEEEDPMKFAIACATVLFSTVGTATVIGLACCGYKFIELYFAVKP